MKRRLLFSSIYTACFFLVFLFGLLNHESVKRDISEIFDVEYIQVFTIFACIFLVALAGSYVITFGKKRGKSLYYFLTSTTVVFYLGFFSIFSYLITEDWRTSRLSEKEQLIKSAKQRGDNDTLRVIQAADEILNAPPPTEAEVDALVNNAINNMVRIEGGEFIMGVSPERMGGDWEGWKPTQNNVRQQASIRDTAFYEHPVKLDTYFLSKYETSYAEFDAWKKLTGKKIRFNSDRVNATYKSMTIGVLDCCRAPSKPAAADWYEAKAYCEWLGEQSGLPVTLPTEAQWEYAARERGKWLMYPTGWGGIDANTNGNGTLSIGTNPIKSLELSFNDLGLYYMAGNLSEWVLDWYNPDYYEISPTDNPSNTNDKVKVRVFGSRQEFAKVHRGGNNFQDTSLGIPINVFNRFYEAQDYYSYGSVGIRCAVNSQQLASLSPNKTDI